MKNVDDETKRLARSSLIWYGLGLACGIVLAVFLVANTIRMIVYPVRAATESAVAIGAGNLDQVVPITSDDELGQLALAFNTMARQLREYRQSHKAQLIRASGRAKPRSTPFPRRSWWSIRRAAWKWRIRRPAASSVSRTRSMPARRRRSGTSGSLAAAFGRSLAGTARSTCPKALTRSSFCNRRNSPIPISRGFCRFAMPRR